MEEQGFPFSSWWVSPVWWVGNLRWSFLKPAGVFKLSSSTPVAIESPKGEGNPFAPPHLPRLPLLLPAGRSLALEARCIVMWAGRLGEHKRFGGHWRPLGGYKSSRDCSCSSAMNCRDVASKHGILWSAAIFELLPNPLILWGLRSTRQAGVLPTWISASCWNDSRDVYVCVLGEAWQLHLAAAVRLRNSEV